MVNFKEWSLKHIGDVLLLALFTTIVVAMFHLVISPLLVTILPTIFITKLTITDTLLFVLLMVVLGKK